MQVALVSIPPHKFVRPPCWYCRLQEIEKYGFKVVPDGITSLPNFIQMRPAVLELNHTDRQDQSCVHFMHIAQRTNNNVKKECVRFDEYRRWRFPIDIWTGAFTATKKLSRATSLVKWLKGKKPNVSRTISDSIYPEDEDGDGSRIVGFFSPFNQLTRLVARENFIIPKDTYWRWNHTLVVSEVFTHTHTHTHTEIKQYMCNEVTNHMASGVIWYFYICDDDSM
jgi:hypothetical protein